MFVGGRDDGEETAGCDGAGDGGPALQVRIFTLFL